MSTRNTEQFIVAIRRKLDDKIAGFLKSHFSLGDGSTCIQATNTFQEAARFDRNYMLPIDRNTQVLFGHLQDNLQEHYIISITPIDKESGAPDFFDREYFNGKYPISRGEWQHYFSKLAEKCDVHFTALSRASVHNQRRDQEDQRIYNRWEDRDPWVRVQLRSDL